jgi:hypothetical protein
MATSKRRGFVPSRHLTGGTGAPRSKLYEAVETRSTPLAIGDAVTLDAAGAVIALTNATADTARFLGVVRALYNTDKRPLTHNLPNTAAFLPTSVAGFVDVMDDPDMTFIVECDTSVGLSNIGQAVFIVVTAMNTAVGVSRMHVTLTTVAGSPVPFRIIGLSPFDEVTGETGAANRVEVVAVAGLFK